MRLLIPGTWFAPQQEWPGLTNAKAQTGDCSAVLLAPDPASRPDQVLKVRPIRTFEDGDPVHGAFA